MLFLRIFAAALDSNFATGETAVEQHGNRTRRLNAAKAKSAPRHTPRVKAKAAPRARR